MKVAVSGISGAVWDRIRAGRFPSTRALTAHPARSAPSTNSSGQSPSSVCRSSRAVSKGTAVRRSYRRRQRSTSVSLTLEITSCRHRRDVHDHPASCQVSAFRGLSMMPPTGSPIAVSQSMPSTYRRSSLSASVSPPASRGRLHILVLCLGNIDRACPLLFHDRP